MKKVEQIFGIKIENTLLFERALTHPSYSQENSLDYCECYERLEFLGDAVLKLIMSDILYRKFPNYNEGQMSKIRAIIISDNILSSISKEVGLSSLIKASKHDLKQGIQNLESVTACAFEAVLGAYYLDGKFDILKNKLEDFFISHIEMINKNLDKYNAKAILQEYTQSLDKKTPEYRLISESGPAHNKVFTVEVLYNGKIIASASGKSKKEAEQKCAYEACLQLGVLKCQK